MNPPQKKFMPYKTANQYKTSSTDVQFLTVISSIDLTRRDFDSQNGEEVGDRNERAEHKNILVAKFKQRFSQKYKRH